ncbi:hypothetical protein NDU88_004636 [Pleurodeles waltl]|uniref:Uncharacterized protein n=1 Tax=Pleurodeles waltl TaxID=8319 RepID=A0AAV7T9Y8_PLEWA|nr:hypothetical protein NDU88_004636 [Pleurodeles waltl]
MPRSGDGRCVQHERALRPLVHLTSPPRMTSAAPQPQGTDLTFQPESSHCTEECETHPSFPDVTSEQLCAWKGAAAGTGAGRTRACMCLHLEPSRA